MANVMANVASMNSTTVETAAVPTSSTDRNAIAWVLNDAGMEGTDRLKYADAILASPWLAARLTVARTEGL